MSPKLIRSRLLFRGVELSSPTTNQTIRTFERSLNIQVSDFFEGLYKQFNGFVVMDSGSLLKVWSLEEIVSRRGDAQRRFGRRYFPVADFLIDSDFLMYSQDDGGVFMQSKTYSVGRTLREFYMRLLRGDFDKIKLAD